jgi:hypothetical protein
MPSLAVNWTVFTMRHTLEIQVIRSRRIDGRRYSKPWIALLEWKADGVLIESGEYTIPELERLVAEMRSDDPSIKFCKGVLNKFKRTADT